MTIPSISIRPLSPEEFEAYRSSDWVISSAPSAVSRDVAAVPLPDYSWLRLERSLEGGVARYFVRIDSSDPSRSGEEGSPLSTGLRTLSMPEGVSLLQVYMGDFQQDGINDIIVRLSSGALILIEAREDEEGTSEAGSGTSASDERSVEPYDPEPTPPSNNPPQEPNPSPDPLPARRREGPPPPPAAPSRSSTQNGHDYLDGI